ncbi:Macrophage colony-stimulating factor 1 receptor [Pleosporales sp. CAS-2024a]
MARIVAEPLDPRNGFNWVFLVELLICGILTIFFLFYFNRLFATLVSYGIRAYTWHAFHTYIDITSLQLSLLGGRVFFKDLRYHGHNETILVHGGYITWNYWLRRVRDAAVYTDREPAPDRESSEPPSTPTRPSRSRSRNVDKAEKGGESAPKQLPCRISVKLSGVEAFMYNRSVAYDAIIDAVKRKEAHGNPHATARDHSAAHSPHLHNHHENLHNKLSKPSTRDDTHANRASTNSSTTSTSAPKKAHLPAFLRLLPIYLEANKGAIVVGNENTPAVITAQFDRASGTLDAGPSGPLDVYQQLFNFQVTHPVVHMKPNADYKATQLDTATHIKETALYEDTGEHVGEKARAHQRRRRWLPSLPSITAFFFAKSSDSIHTHTKSAPDKGSSGLAPQRQFPGQERWQGLARYLDDGVTDDHGEWDGIEYAKTSLIADIPCVNLSFYWDVTGPVLDQMDNSMDVDPAHPHDINGAMPPEYGMDIQIFGGTVNYGPWTDRHRAIFQNIFFPASHVDALVTPPLKPRQLRVLSVFKLYLSIEEDIVLRIPIREPSKDWKWKGKAHTLAAHDKPGTDKTKNKAKARRRRGKRGDNGAAQNVRPFAWIDVKVAGNSSVNYIMDMYASENGFQNKLDVDITNTEISSSVNHGLLWRSGSITLDCDLSAPIAWNALRTWIFNIRCKDLELFLLRDHLFLITDLVADWGSGPPPQYFLFVPFRYLLNLDFADFKLYLNTNDSNIVNNPADLDDNNFVILSGERIHGDVSIPLDKYRPLQNELTFNVNGHNLALEVLMPPKNTLKTFVQSPNVARLGGLTLTGSHTAMTETSPMNTDRLFMDIQGHRLNLELYGWLVHHFIKVKDNYFGDDLHFKTLEEFQGLPSTSPVADGSEPNGEHAKLSNDLDVILSVSADEASILLPANLYSATRSIRADLPYASADLRFTNYYMDLMANFSPINLAMGGSSGSGSGSGSGSSPEASKEFSSGRTEIFLDSTVIFGHRLFGLPPTEPAYVCNWDFDIGRLSGECTSEFIETAAGAARSFGFTLNDDENSLPLTEVEVVHDVTYLRLKTHEIHVWMHVAQEALLLRTDAISLHFDDLAGHTFSQRLSARIPNLTISGVNARCASRHRTHSSEKKKTLETHAFLQTTLSLNLVARKLDFSQERNRQQAHVQLQDQRTNRAQFMLLDNNNDLSVLAATKERSNSRAPAMQYPDIAHPVFLLQPQSNRSASSTISSELSSSYSSVKHQLHHSSSVRSGSSASITSSIRSTAKREVRRRRSTTVASSRSQTVIGGSPHRLGSMKRQDNLYTEEERRKRNLAPSSVALTSPLTAPYFPLEQIEPDLSEVPSLPTYSTLEQERDASGVMFNDVPTKHLDESFTHTSLLISAEPGIRVFCTPVLISCISDLIELIQPQRPEDLLDEFQVRTMTRILENRNRLEGKGSSLEVNVRIPFTHIRFQHEFESPMKGGKDQYDIILNRWRMSARIKKFPGDRVGENSLALHTTLGSLGMSVTERSLDVTNQDVAIQAEVSDVLVWMVQNKASSINVSFRSLETAAASKKVDYFASLIHRTTLLANALITKFARAKHQQQRRLRYLAWYLTSVQNRYSDPEFLIKASYALRAARDHLRSHDSWKIISRFRFTWQCLPEVEKESLLDACTQDTVQCPEDAETKIIDMWDQWRAWDLAHVEKSLAMRLLFDCLEDSLPTPDSAAPLHLDLKSAEIKIILDPGPRQSEVALRMLAINVALLPPTDPSGLMLVVDSETPRKSAIIQASSQEATFHVQWEICELAEALLELFRKEDMIPKSVKMPKIPSPPNNHEVPRAIEQDIQIIFVAEKAQIIFDTINLQSTTTARHLKFAFMDMDQKSSGLGEILSAHVHMDVAVSELSSRGRSLAKTQYQQPSVYFALVEHDKGSSIPLEIKVAAASRMISVKVDEDVLGFIEVADSVLRDEVAYFTQQSAVIKAMSKKSDMQHVTPSAASSQLPNVTLALFMDAYRIELALLQPLGWSITGSAGRIAVVPALGRNVTLQIDYDLEASHHRMYSTSALGSNVISTIKLPPINGRLAVSQTERETRIFASGIIETIQLQASELQALATTVNKPEFSHMVEAIQDDIGVLKSHMEDVFPSSSHAPVVETSVPSRDILFGVQMTLSGVHVMATAPGRTRDAPTANLILRLSSVQLKATNIDSDEQIKLYSEATIRLNEVTVGLSLKDATSTRHCGNLTFGAVFQATTEKDSEPIRRLFRLHSTGLEVNMFADTASAVVDVVNHLQDKIKDLDISKEKKYLRRLRHTKSRISQTRAKSIKSDANTDEDDSIDSGALFTSTYALELLDMQICWIVGSSITPFPRNEIEDLVLSFRKIGLSTHRDDAARLLIEDMQLQMVPVSNSKKKRSLNSALLPTMVFNVAYASTKETRKVAFQAAGKSLDLQLDSHFILPANVIERSIALAGRKFRKASANWSMTPTTTGAQRKSPFGNKRFASVTVDANFAGAVVHINGGGSLSAQNSSSRAQQKGRYSQFVGDGSASSLALRAPGVAIRIEYQDNGHDPSLNAEVRVDGSSNTLLPTVVPIIIDISESIKVVVRDKDPPAASTDQVPTQGTPAAKAAGEDSNIMATDPSALLGRTSLNLGLRICKQEFSLSCQPIARVTAIAKLEDIYVTANSVKSREHGHFFAASASFEKLQVRVQHVYSRESTFGLDVESIVLSLMNSKHLNGTSGISTILKINPTTMQVNARQLQDFLLFREVWYPPEIRQASKPPTDGAESEPSDYLIQRYEQVTAATAFPWNANVAIADIKVDLDLGQAIGRSSLHIHNMWASSKKNTDWEQNLCIGVQNIGIESTGRTSGFVDLHGIKVRTSISWPAQPSASRRTPLIQASITFQQLLVKSGFDYQAFLMADIADFGFLMYNVREEEANSQDRLVAILDGGKVHVFCHATSAAQGLALYQAIERLVQESQQAYKQSLKDVEKFTRRKSSAVTSFARSPSQSMMAAKFDDESFKAPISLHTDVVVTLRSIKFGVFPSTFIDTQILLLTAGDMQARFAVALDDGKIHSTLGMTLGQLSVALSSAPSPKKDTAVTDLTVSDVACSAQAARGGTILRVPKVVATMHTWQVPKSNHIDYLFKSSLEGKVDVGWNYSRIGSIRTMWSNHSRSLASRLGKPLPESNIKISASQTLADGEEACTTSKPRAQSDAAEGKITAVVNVPQSKYEYTPLEPPLIETPQLRDMGEATPPLEWIGLHRDRLPNVTHQIVIVTLLEVAREVEDAYGRILGSS